MTVGGDRETHDGLTCCDYPSRSCSCPVLLRHVSIAGGTRVGSTRRRETDSVRILSSVSCGRTQRFCVSTLTFSIFNINAKVNVHNTTVTTPTYFFGTDPPSPQKTLKGVPTSPHRWEFPQKFLHQKFISAFAWSSPYKFTGGDMVP